LALTQRFARLYAFTKCCCRKSKASNRPPPGPAIDRWPVDRPVLTPRTCEDVLRRCWRRRLDPGTPHWPQRTRPCFGRRRGHACDSNHGKRKFGNSRGRRCGCADSRKMGWRRMPCAAEPGWRNAEKDSSFCPGPDREHCCISSPLAAQCCCLAGGWGPAGSRPRWLRAAICLSARKYGRGSARRTHHRGNSIRKPV